MLTLTGHGFGSAAANKLCDIDLVIDSDTHDVCVWNTGGEKVANLEGYSDRVITAAFHPRFPLILTASNDKTVKLWKLDGSLLYAASSHISKVNSASFNSFGEYIVSSSKDGDTKIWQFEAE